MSELTASDIVAARDLFNPPPGMILDLLLTAAERARVVGVLDAWAERNEGFAFKTDLCPHDCNTDEPWLCGPSPAGKHRKLARRGETADAARAAAAKAIESGEL